MLGCDNVLDEKVDEQHRDEEGNGLQQASKRGSENGNKIRGDANLEIGEVQSELMPGAIQVRDGSAD